MNIWLGSCPSFEICPGLHSVRCMLNSISGIKCVHPLVVKYHGHFVEKKHGRLVSPVDQQHHMLS